MKVEIRHEDASSLPAYTTIPSSFDVQGVVDVDALRAGGPLATRVAIPRRKDYDAIPGNGPLSWPTRFDVGPWIWLAAYEHEKRIGGAVIVPEHAAVSQLAGRPGSAILWDLRVATAWRRHGVGTALLARSEAAARVAGCVALDVETQDVNVAACRLYAESGYTLIAATRDTYPDAPNETRLMWTKQLI